MNKVEINLKLKIKFLVLDAAITLIMLALDQLTKYLAIVRLKDRPPIVLIDGVLELRYLENTGSAFSLFQNQKFLLLFLGFAVMIVLFYALLRLPNDKKFRISHILLAVLIAGALGNIIDRLRYDYVVDFISFVLINFPVFNVADCFLVVATISLFILFMFVYKEEDLDFLSLKKNQTGDPADG